MTSLMKTTSELQYQLVQTFIKSQTDHMSDLPDDSFDMSAELFQNQTDLSDRLPTDTDAKVYFKFIHPFSNIIVFFIYFSFL